MRPVVQTVLRLHLESRSYHADVDASWLGIIDDAIGTTDYARQLARVYGFEAPLEAALAYTPHVQSLIDLRQIGLSGMIAQDLLELGLTPPLVSGLPELMLAPFQSVAEGLGWMYVLERSRVIHATVRMRLASALPEVDRACSYLDVSNELASARWARIGELIERVARTPAIEHRVLTAAHDGFRQLIAWHRGDEKQSASAP